MCFPPLIAHADTDIHTRGNRLLCWAEVLVVPRLRSAHEIVSSVVDVFQRKPQSEVHARCPVAEVVRNSSGANQYFIFRLSSVTTDDKLV